jgi:hypothetical protein
LRERSAATGRILATRLLGRLRLVTRNRASVDKGKTREEVPLIERAFQGHRVVLPPAPPAALDRPLPQTRQGPAKRPGPDMHLSSSPEARYRTTEQSPQPGSSGPSVVAGVALSAVAGGVAVRGHRDAVTNRSGPARHMGRRGRAVVVSQVAARPGRAVGVDIGCREVVRR